MYDYGEYPSYINTCKDFRVSEGHNVSYIIITW